MDQNASEIKIYYYYYYYSRLQRGTTKRRTLQVFHGEAVQLEQLWGEESVEVE